MANIINHTNGKSNSITSDKERVLTSSLIRSADWLEVNSTILSQIIGVSNATMSRMKKGEYIVDINSKQYELGAMLIRVYRSLFAIVGGDRITATKWLLNYNTALEGVPLELMKTIRGLNETINYLDARRSVI